MANDSGVHPGWYADPLRRFELRYYNGTSWTADVSTDGDRFVDPLGLELPDRSSAGVSAGAPAVNSAANSAVNSGANSPATAAMVLGIIAIAISWLPFVVVLGAVAAVLALAFGTVGIRRSTPTGVGRSRAVVGLVTGASALVLAALGAALTFVVLDVYDAYLDPGPHETTITCEVVGSRAIASGTLENLGTDTADFSVLVGFVRRGTDNPRRTGRAVLEDVEPGETTEFQVERQIDLDDADCIVLEVTGPLPFGLSLD